MNQEIKYLPSPPDAAASAGSSAFNWVKLKFVEKVTWYN